MGGCELGGLRSSSPSQGQVHRGAAEVNLDFSFAYIVYYTKVKCWNSAAFDKCSVWKCAVSSFEEPLVCWSVVFKWVSTPPAKKTEPSNLVLRAQDHKKNPKFKGWQWDLKNPKFKIRSSKERRTKSEITEIVVEKYVFKIPKIQNFRNTRNQ